MLLAGRAEDMSEINEVKSQPATLDASAWLASIVENSEDAILSKTLGGIILSWNEGAEKLFGYTADEAIGKSITIIIPQERLHEEDAIIESIKAGRRVDHFETVRRRKDGTMVDVSLTISPVRDRNGKLLGASKVARDITHARRFAEEQNLILHEMNHRIKNLFSLATSLVSLSSREAETKEALASDLQARLVALAKAHEITLSGPHRPQMQTSTALHDLLSTILRPYQGEHGARIEASGHDAPIGQRSLPSVALLLHELTTNAAKYGALSAPEGSLTVTLESDGQQVHLVWTESGIPRAEGSMTEGFGSRLESLSVRGLGGVITRAWQSDGLVIDLTIPLETLAQ
ncbi:PAS domain S-box protein [Novosphingobium rosa]|uniref:PAS domain S-box protein n=1 Tax=Novosphingobium rosa TaxID=76978 RepID=UPI000B1D7C8D|nr:PAS domain S-box protein [Novosphingobium rosa]